MNEQLKQIAIEAKVHHCISHVRLEAFAELIAEHCANICMEMAAKCAGLEGDGALAKDCAYWIKEDFGIKND
jgi:hypothetical protein